jgi:hypothetical protein
MKTKLPTVSFKVFIILTFLISINWQSGYSQDRSIFDLMQQKEVLDLQLFTNMDQLDSMRKTNTYQPATLSFTNQEDKTLKWAVKVRPRGKYRRKICDRPPLKLNFVKGQLKAANLNNDDELKLVTQCLDGYNGKEYILREYLAYQLFNILSEASFRAQLVKIQYNCTASGKKENSWGIVIEDEKSLERRLNASVCDDCYSRPKQDFVQACLSTATLFQYMIGNADYSITMSRNIKILKSKEEGVYRVAPYDFDFSGLVNPSYALPNVNYNQSSVRDRIFLGLCNDQELANTMAHFINKKAALLQCVKDFKELSKNSRNDIKRYILTFYNAIEDGEIIRP